MSIPQILALHNEKRSEVGVPQLLGLMDLNRSAQQWAEHLAAIHAGFSPPHSGPGENIAVASKGSLTDLQLVGLWIDEQKNFIPGQVFEASETDCKCSKTHNWKNIGHYTQMIWYSTTSMGCGKASDDSFDYLVCQYGPPGNVKGEYPLGHP